MKKLTWKNHKPLICLLLATVILLLFAVWSRPKPVLLESDGLRLISVEIFSETERYDEMTFVTSPDAVSTDDNEYFLLTSEQEAQIIRRLSQATSRRELMFTPNWESAGITPDRPDSPWHGLTVHLFLVSDHSQPFCRDIILGEFSAERGSVLLPSLADGGLVSHPLSSPIDNGDQVTADILHILELE